MNWVTIDQAAALCRAAGRTDIRKRTIRNYVADGRLPSCKSGPGLTAPYLVDLDAVLVLPPIPKAGRPPKAR